MADLDITSLNGLQAFFTEFYEESPRGAVIIAIVLFDAQLEKLLENQFICEPKSIKLLFDEKSGSLSNFYGKTELAYRLGLIDKEAFNDLNIIRKIRNEFAHNMINLSFQDKKIVDYCNKLNYGNIPLGGKSKTPEKKFQIAVAALMNYLNIEIYKSTKK